MEDKSIKTLLLEQQKEIRQKPVQTQTTKINLTELKAAATTLKKEEKEEEIVAAPTFEVKKQEKTWTRQEKKQEKKSSLVVQKNQINFFGGEYDLKSKAPEPEKAKESISADLSSSASVVTPNYDFIEELPPEEDKKVVKIEKTKKESKASPLLKKLKLIACALIFCLLMSWNVYNGIELGNLSTEYDLKLGQYVSKLATLDSASSADDIFPTYPEENIGASNISPRSNWFDRLCDFMAKLFGG